MQNLSIIQIFGFNLQGALKRAFYSFNLRAFFYTPSFQKREKLIYGSGLRKHMLFWFWPRVEINRKGYLEWNILKIKFQCLSKFKLHLSRKSLFTTLQFAPYIQFLIFLYLTDSMHLCNPKQVYLLQKVT